MLRGIRRGEGAWIFFFLMTHPLKGRGITKLNIKIYVLPINNLIHALSGGELEDEVFLGI